MLTLSSDGRWLELPALATAHSHAFQRGMRGAAQRSSAAGAASDGAGARREERADFWSCSSFFFLSTPWLMSEDCSWIAEKIPQELASNIYSLLVYPILRITSRAISCTSR